MQIIPQISFQENIVKDFGDNLQNEQVLHWIQNQISTRVILIGAPGSGKTTFIRLVQNRSQFPTENIATDGIAISNTNNMTFWDFGGQEVLFSTHKFFLVDRCQYILVVDLSKLIHNDEKIRNDSLKFIDFWMKEIHCFTLNHQNSPPVLFLGTHCDLIDNLFTNSKIEKGKTILLNLAKSNDLNCIQKIFKFYKSSRKSTLKKNISGILNQIQVNAEKFIKNDLGLANNDNVFYSFQFSILKHNIESKRQSNPFMFRNDFENMFFNKESNEIINKFTKLLKVSGIIETYRFESSAASEIIFLDPKWLSDTFTSIVSIQMQSSKNKRGFFSRNQIETNFNSRKIPENIWDEILTIFEMFHLIVLLPSGEYYIPTMLHTPKFTKPSHFGNEKNELVIDQFKEKNIKYKCIRRKYEFSPRIPFGFIDKLIVKYLHFPGFIMHESTWANDFYLYSIDNENSNHKFYHILIQTMDQNNDFMNKELLISVFYPENEEDENNLNLAFFCHFIFQSPHDILTSSVHSTSSIENVFILGENFDPIGEEKDILFNFHNNLHFKHYFISSNIEIFDSEVHNCKFTKKMPSGGFGEVYLGKIQLNLSKKQKNTVVFKESRFISFETLRKLINECMMMKIIENQFTIKLIGICIPSKRLLESRKTIQDSFSNFNEEEYLNHQLLMITEEPPWGDLTHCKEIIQNKSTKFKLKIALDIARGLNSLYSKSGVKLIHRDIKSENVFIFSLDEKSILNFESSHAKLGDFGSIVIASPSYSQKIENYQYTAPEALHGSFLVPYSKEIDVYSFGILLWEILSGKIPFQELKENPETFDIIKMIIDGYRPPLHLMPDDTPNSIIEIIKDCLCSKPSKRPAMGEIISILSEILSNP